MMITANEAKQLYDNSGVEIEEYLKYKIEPEVTKAASGGKRTVTILIGSLDIFHHLDQVIKPIEKGVGDKLKELGYHVKIEHYGDRYTPRGMMKDDGSGPLHQNYGFVIRW